MKNIKKIGIIHYNSGNIGSLIKTIKKFNQNVLIVKSVKDFDMCDKIILPGVGSFDIAINFLKKKKLLLKLRNFILNGGDTLGICLGMQILYKSSEESKDSNGIGIIKRKIKKLVRDKNLSIPHVGWNKLIIFKNSKNGLINIIKNDRFYFSHSFGDKVFKKDNSVYYKYGKHYYNSIVIYKNFIGLQFHPELSGIQGLKIFNFFLNRK